MTPVANFPTGTAGVVIPGAYFPTVSTILVANLPPVSMTAAVNLPPVSTSQVANNGNEDEGKNVSMC